MTCLVISHPALDQTSLTLTYDDGVNSSPDIAVSNSIEVSVVVLDCHGLMSRNVGVRYETKLLYNFV